MDSRQLKVLVTGGCGALGSRLCSALLAAGHYVAVFDRIPPPFRVDDFEVADIRDADALFAFAGRQGELSAVVHLVSLLNRESSANPSLALDVNCHGFINACEAARIAGIPRLVWASSIGVFGDHDSQEIVTDDRPYSPRNLYAATKVLNEFIADKYFEDFGIETISLRFTFMISAGKNTGNSGLMTQELIEKPLKGAEGRLPWRYGGQNWLAVDDAAEVIMRIAAKRELSQRHFNVGGENCSVKDVVSLVQELIPGAVISLSEGRRLEHRLDDSALLQEIGFVPRRSVRDQLRDMVDIYKSGGTLDTG